MCYSPLTCRSSIFATAYELIWAFIEVFSLVYVWATVPAIECVIIKNLIGARAVVQGTVEIFVPIFVRIWSKNICDMEILLLRYIAFIVRWKHRFYIINQFYRNKPCNNSNKIGLPIHASYSYPRPRVWLGNGIEIRDQEEVIRMKQKTRHWLDLFWQKRVKEKHRRFVQYSTFWLLIMNPERNSKNSTMRRKKV